MSDVGMILRLKITFDTLLIPYITSGRGSRGDPQLRTSQHIAVAAMLVAGSAFVATVPAYAVSAAPRSAITGSTLVTGVVTRDGEILENADIIATAWPKQEVLDQLTAGETVPLKVVATGTTNDAGQFALSVDAATVGDDYLSDTQSVDIELSAADGTQQVDWNFTAELVGQADGITKAWSNPRIAGRPSSAKSRAQVAPTRLLIDLGKNSKVTQDGEDPAGWVGPDNEPLGKAAATAATLVTAHKRTISSGRARDFVACSTTATNEYDRARQEVFANAIGTPDSPATVIQKNGTEHTLGIAVKGASNGSGFKEEGTLTKSFSASASTEYTNAYQVSNRVNYRKYVFICTPLASKTIWRPDGYSALNAQASTIRYPAWNALANCNRYVQGTFTKTAGSNATFSAGVDLSAVNVSSNAKFNSETEMSWTILHNKWIYLCGSTRSGWVSSPQAGTYY
jgi:hypothetical protein